jgi:predicted amidohydrolase
VSVAQFPTGGSIADSRFQIRSAIERASAAETSLVVLPEESMIASLEAPADLGIVASQEWQPFVDFVCELATEFSVAIIVGGYEPGPHGRPYNSLLAVNSSGEVLAVYRKIHLYDGFNYRESDEVEAGIEPPAVIDIDGFRIGLITCYDLRFPELARVLVDRGADVLSISAAWVRGPRKEDHWTTLVRARAIENTCWVLAAGSTAADCIGESMIVDPFGVVQAAAGAREVAIETVEISLERVAEVRRTHPALANRRLAGTVAMGF